MTDITQIPTSELQSDLAATRADIVICVRAIHAGVEYYDDGKSVTERLEGNRKTRGVIIAELHRRGEKV